MRSEADPRCSSARESLSAQSLSPVVIGRLGTASTQSSVPAGLKETAPLIWLRRATRLGGSSSSAAARWGNTNATASKAANKLTNLREAFRIGDSLLSSEGGCRVAGQL